MDKSIDAHFHSPDTGRTTKLNNRAAEDVGCLRHRERGMLIVAKTQSNGLRADVQVMATSTQATSTQASKNTDCSKSTVEIIRDRT